MSPQIHQAGFRRGVWLVQATNFEQFLHRRYPGTKRFSLEGAESLIPLLALILDKSAKMGAQRCMVGMAHHALPKPRILTLVSELPSPLIFSQIAAILAMPRE